MQHTNTFGYKNIISKIYMSYSYICIMFAD